MFRYLLILIAVSIVSYCFMEITHVAKKYKGVKNKGHAYK